MVRKLSEGISRATERKVRYHLDCCEQFMAARSKFFPRDITATDAVEFKASWSTWKSSVTRQKAQQNIRGFVRFICKGDHRDEILDAFGKIKESRADSDRLEPKPFTEAELEELLDRVPVTFPDNVKAARVTALIHSMVSTGLAIRDTVQLEIASIKDGRLSIKRQKTGKAVTQRLDPALHRELMAVTNGNPSTSSGTARAYQRAPQECGKPTCGHSWKMPGYGSKGICRTGSVTHSWISLWARDGPWMRLRGAGRHRNRRRTALREPGQQEDGRPTREVASADMVTLSCHCSAASPF